MLKTSTHKKGKSWVVPENQFKTFINHEVCYDQLFMDCEKSLGSYSNTTKPTPKKKKNVYEIEI
jgi:hypothetical protein